MLILCIVVYFFIIRFDFIPLIKEKNKKVISIYTILILTSLILIILYNFDIKVPSPMIPIDNIIKAIFGV